MHQSNHVIMKRELIIGIVLVIVIVLVIILGVCFYLPLDKTEEGKCKSLTSLDNSDETKEIIGCYLNDKKSLFKTDNGDVALEILKGECIITEIKDRYLDNKNNQVVNEPCTECHLDGAEVWFECSEYDPQGPFGCFFNIKDNYSFDVVRCPLEV